MRKGQIRKNKTYGEGRICVKCGAVMSTYTKGNECRCHSLDPKVNPVRFKKAIRISGVHRIF